MRTRLSATSRTRNGKGTALASINVLLAIAMPLSTALHRIAPRARPEVALASKGRGPVTPSAKTFAIWAPLFAGNLWYAFRVARSRKRDVSLGRLGWLGSTAYALNTAWSLRAQLHSLGWKSAGLLGAATASSVAATLVAGHDASRSRIARWASIAIAPLAGWLTVASFANIETAMNNEGRRPSRAEETRRARLLVAGASGAAATMAIMTRGNLPYAAAAWGLGGILVRNRSARPPVARAAAVGLALVATATLAARLRRE